MSPITYKNALSAAIRLAHAPVLVSVPQTSTARVALLLVIDDGETVLSPTGKRVKSVDYAVSRWIAHAIERTQCAHSSRLTGILANDGGAL